MTNANTHRWNGLVEKYQKATDLGADDASRVSRFAVQLRKEFALACGCDEKEIHFYRYDIARGPINDRFKIVKFPSQAIQITENGWVFGLGVRFENNAAETAILIFYILAKVSNNSFDIESSLFAGQEIINTDPPQYGQDLRNLSERLYRGLDESLDALSGSSSATVGFKFQSS